MRNDDRPRDYRKDTLLTHLGRDPRRSTARSIRPSITPRRSSRRTSPNGRTGRDPKTQFGVVRYGLSGTPTTFALEELLAKIEGGYRAAIVSSGLAAVTAPLQACVSAGDHVLMVNSVYGPARNFCNRVLTRFGVETTYYDPLIGDGISG